MIKKIITEALAGGPLSPVESAPINLLSDNPVVAEIKSYFKKDLKDVELVKVNENGDIYLLDLRFVIDKPDLNMQFVREEAKQRAYDIKRKIEAGIMSKFHIPSFSITGVRVTKGTDKVIFEFEISFIYANTGNIKPTNESIQKDKRVRAIVEAALKSKPVITSSKPVDPLKEAVGDDDSEISEVSLEEQLKEWKKLSLQIQQHEEAFRKMIEIQLASKREVEEKVFNMMHKLDVKTKKVDDIVAKIKAGGFRDNGPTPTEKVAILMSKINEATKKVVMAEFAAKTVSIPFAAHKSISIEKPVKESVGDTIKSGYNKFKSVLSSWAASAKEMFSAVDELERLVGGSIKEDDQIPFTEESNEFVYEIILPTSIDETTEIIELLNDANISYSGCIERGDDIPVKIFLSPENYEIVKNAIPVKGQKVPKDSIEPNFDENGDY